MQSFEERDGLVARRRLRLAELGEIMKARPLTRAEASAREDLLCWDRRHRTSRRSRLPALIEAAIRRVVAAERRLSAEATRPAARAVTQAKARLDRYRREQAEIARG